MIHWILLGLLVFLTPVSVSAFERQGVVPDSCLLLQSNTAYRNLDIDQLQAGIRAFYGNDLTRFVDEQNNGEAILKNLSDGKIGNLSRNAMVDICIQLDRLDFSNPDRAAIELAMEYGWLLNRAPTWPELLRDRDFITDLHKTGPTALLMLAGSKEATLRYLTEPALNVDNSVCDELYASFSDLTETNAKRKIDDGARGIVNVFDVSASELPPSERLAMACRFINAQGKPAEVFESLSEYANLDAHVVSGLARLTDPEFTTWWVAQPAITARFLFGSSAAVKTLVSQFIPINKNAISACGEQDQDFTYYKFDPLSEKEPAASPLKVLPELATRQFNSSIELVDAVASELGFDAGSCEFGIITQVVARNSPLVRQYTLSIDAIDRLENETKIENLAANLTPELTPEKLEMAVLEATGNLADENTLEEINIIADRAAQLAEAMTLENDTSAIEGDATVENPQVPAAYALTEESMKQLLDTVQDADIADALQSAPYIEKSDRNQIRLFVMSVLLAVYDQRQLDNAVQVQQVLQTGTIEQWSVTDSLVYEIAARPDLADIDPVDPDALKELEKALGGISYLNRRLMERSLLSPISIPGQIPALSKVQRNSLLDQSRVSVNTDDDRKATVLATSCGCGLRRGKEKQIYSIHPFWKWPLSESLDQEEGGAPLLDFAYVDRIAFDGVIMNYTADGSAQEISNTNKHTKHWYSAGSSFTETAHRFEADVDLVFRIAGWETWNEDNVSIHAQEIASILNSQTTDSNWPFLSPKYSTVPDGVALFFQSPGDQDIDKTILELFFDVLRATLEKHQQITVGFDINLDAASETIKIFEDFSTVLLGAEKNGQSDENTRSDPPIDRVLVFLERPTTATKKMLYRLILEMSQFRGSNRSDLFRKIIPVVPPEAHKELRRLNRNDKAVGAEIDGRFEETYGQFFDDLVFFDDNFSGIGFWPALYENASDPTHSDDVKDLIRIRFNQYFYTTAFGVQYKALDELFDKTLTPVCRYICPNRNILYTVTVVFCVVIVLLLIFGISSRYRPLAGRAIHYGFASIVAVHMAILICSQSELRLASILIAVTLAIWKVYTMTVKPDKPLP